MFESVLLLYFKTFFILLAAHCLADFPLQGDFLAKIKDPSRNTPEFWVIGLFSHSVIHAGAVLVITGYLSLALVQFFTHFAIDYSKCRYWFGEGDKSFVIDQLLHYAVLGITAWVFVVMST